MLLRSGKVATCNYLMISNALQIASGVGPPCAALLRSTVPPRLSLSARLCLSLPLLHRAPPLHCSFSPPSASSPRVLHQIIWNPFCGFLSGFQKEAQRKLFQNRVLENSEILLCL
ncbi:hypothetical protein ABKV19_026390 [Rosa sericea]